MAEPAVEVVEAAPILELDGVSAGPGAIDCCICASPMTACRCPLNPSSQLATGSMQTANLVSIGLTLRRPRF